MLQDIATLDRPTIFIGCSQDGLTDPDFSRLDSFLTEWQDVAPRRYWLIRQNTDSDGQPKPIPSPDHPRRLFPLPFGTAYDDLTPFLRSVAPIIKRSDPERSVRTIDHYEPKPEIFGRDDEVRTVVEAVLAGKPAIVAGGPGMGKTTVATAALYDPQVTEQFGRRRVFVSLDSASEPRALLAQLAAALGLSATGDTVSLLRLIEIDAGDDHTAAVLDNAETVFEADYGEAERLLKLAAQIKGLSLVTTIRGAPPAIPSAAVIGDLPKLEPGAAREAFLSVSGSEFANDDDLDHLLDALDGHALSIRIIAAQAIGLSSLAGLRQSWEEAHAEILRQPGSKESHLTSVRASLALSLKSRRMTPLARRLLAIVAHLPGGLAEDGIHNLLGERGAVTRAKANDAIACLHHLRLVERRPDRRLRMLTPLRECVQLDVQLLPPDRSRLTDRYLTIAERGGMIGRSRWEQARAEVETEADNLDPICGLAVTTSPGHRRLERAFMGLAEFHRISGLGGVKSLSSAVNRFRQAIPIEALVTCIECLGRIAYARSDHETARTRYDEALALYRRVDSVLGEANCIQSLGDIAYARSDRETAHGRYEEALALHRRVDNVSGEADCIRKLGDFAYARSDHETARSRYGEALALHRRVGNVIGEANCIESLGDIARARSDQETARTRYGEALALYRRVGGLVGEANCIRGLGDIAYAHSDHETARTHYEEALTLFRRVGNIIGEANCIENLGDIAFMRSNYEAAKSQYDAAVTLNRRIKRIEGEAEATVRRGQILAISGDAAKGLADIQAGFRLFFSVADELDRALPGWRALHLALKTEDAGEAAKQRQIARTSWTEIGRLDLIHDWIDSPPEQP